jgi:transposase
MKITTIGIDLAKEMFQVHGVDAHGKAALRKQLRRSEMMKFFANLEPCLIGMEACGSSHHWARKEAERVRTYGEAHGTTIREAVCQNKQE